MSIELNRKGIAPPISAPMKTSGSAIDSFAGLGQILRRGHLADLRLAADGDHGDERGETG